MNFNKGRASIILLRGGGDLASGVALRLRRVGFQVLVTELAAPLVVRRKAAFAQAVFSGKCQVEEVEGTLVKSADEAAKAMAMGKVAVMIDPMAESRPSFSLFGLIDGRMTKKPPELGMDAAPIVVGLGPGFQAGVDCHAIVETNRGPFLGRVYWQGSAEADNGIPETVRGFTVERVLYAPKSGKLQAIASIGDILEPEAMVAEIDGIPVKAKFKGVLRGLVQTGLEVKKGMKIGDLDPRCDERLCTLVSDKALAVGGGVLEALLSNPNGRK